MTLPEFTCLCPKTGQPDFATFELEYVPDELCVELKSLKLYLWSFRDRGAFHEAVTNQIADDLARRLRAALPAADGQIQRPGRHLHHGGRGTAQAGLDSRRAPVAIALIFRQKSAAVSRCTSDCTGKNSPV